MLLPPQKDKRSKCQVRSKHELFSQLSKINVPATHTAPPFLGCALSLFFFALTNFYNITVPIEKRRLSSKEKPVGINNKVLSNKFSFIPKIQKENVLFLKYFFSQKFIYVFYFLFFIFETGHPSIYNNPLQFFFSFKIGQCTHQINPPCLKDTQRKILWLKPTNVSGLSLICA